MIRTALPGQRYGRLVITAVIDGKTRKCICDCGRETIVTRCNLTSGNTLSCGCLRREIEKVASKTHGETCDGAWSRTYTTYHGMLQRCLNPNNPSWPRYGGRGITVCPRWKRSFKNFLADMGERPDGWSLERIDNSGPYWKGNCVWATETQQQRNKRSNRLIAFRGDVKTLAGWAEELRIPYYTLHARLRRGWSIDEALTTEVKHV